MTTVTHVFDRAPVRTVGAAQGAGPRRRPTSGEYRFYAALAFPLFLGVAAAGRLAPRRSGAPARRPLLREAQETMDSVLPWAFCGR